MDKVEGCVCLQLSHVCPLDLKVVVRWWVWISQNDKWRFDQWRHQWRRFRNFFTSCPLLRSPPWVTHTVNSFHVMPERTTDTNTKSSVFSLNGSDLTVYCVMTHPETGSKGPWFSAETKCPEATFVSSRGCQQRRLQMCCGTVFPWKPHIATNDL